MTSVVDRFSLLTILKHQLHLKYLIWNLNFYNSTSVLTTYWLENNTKIVAPSLLSIFGFENFALTEWFSIYSLIYHRKDIVSVDVALPLFNRVKHAGEFYPKSLNAITNTLLINVHRCMLFSVQSLWIVVKSMNIY